MGAGIAGVSVTLELRRRAAEVTLVEWRRPGAGATCASAGMAAPLYEVYEDSPLVRLGIEGRGRYPEFLDRLATLSGIGVAFSETGMLVANRTAEEETRSMAAAAWQTEAGLESEILSQQEAESLQPGLASADSWLWLPREACFDSQRLGDIFAGSVHGAGARFVTGRVRKVCSAQGRVNGVELTDGERLAGDAVVIAAGAWSGGIEGLPRHLPVEPVRGQIVRLHPSPDVDLTLVVSDHEGHYTVPRRDGSIVAGSTMVRAVFDEATTESGRLDVRTAAGELVPALRGAAESESWAGLRPLCVDDLPIVGPEPLLDGLFYATGFGRRGMLIGPVVGSLLAEMVLEREVSSDVCAFAADRFAATS